MVPKQSLSYLKVLAERYPHREAVRTEIMNLLAILELPKSTELFISDLHGEYNAFLHILKTASGIIQRKIHEFFGDTLPREAKQELLALLCYPHQTLDRIFKEKTREEQKPWLVDKISQIIMLTRFLSEKYTKSKIRKALPPRFAYIFEELLWSNSYSENKKAYYYSIISSVIELNQETSFTAAAAQLIQRLCIDHLHILGDIYDRGPAAHLILDTLLELHSLDIVFGNHDVIWMGAAAGSTACVANVLRICLRYSNLATLEKAYGISLVPLWNFTMNTYQQEACASFLPKTSSEVCYSEEDKKTCS